jgi:hypothetical protein
MQIGQLLLPIMISFSRLRQTTREFEEIVDGEPSFIRGRLANRIARRSTTEAKIIHMSGRTAVAGLLMISGMTIVAMPAYASGVAFQASSLPLQVRGEGQTETIGAVVLQSLVAGTIPAGSSITIAYSGTITNASSFTGQAGLYCSISSLTVCGSSSVLSTSAAGSQLTISFNSTVSFGSGDYIEIYQVRMNVNAMGVSSSAVTATLSGTSSAPTINPITFTQSQVAVASIVNPSLSASIPFGGVATAIQTCSVPAGNTFQVTVRENFPAALTSVTDEQFFSNVGTVNNGSLVNIAINNVPSGMAVAFNGYTTTGSTSLLLTSTSSSYQVSTGSALTFTFIPSNDSTSVVEGFTATFGIGLPNSRNNGLSSSAGSLPAIGTTVNATATVSLAPSSGVVSFASNNEGGGTVVSIGDCVTNLAFPYVSNQNGYDTSLSFSNTTNDDLVFGPGAGAAAQSGNCTLTLWPTTDTTLAAGSPLGTPSQFTTPTIPSGGVYALSLSSTSFSGQTGYIVAVCRFLNAHGFAFLTNGFAEAAGPQLSHGYLGLILPNPISGRSNPNGESAVH